MGLEPAIAKIFPLPVWGKDCFGAINFYKAVVLNRDGQSAKKKKSFHGFTNIYSTYVPV